MTTVKILLSICFVLALESTSGAQTLSLTATNEIVYDTSKASVAVFADFNVRQAVKATDETPMASGALGVYVGSATSDFTFLVNVAGATDTLRSDFGTSILTPGTGGALHAGLIDYRRRDILERFRVGLHAYGSSVSSTWFTGIDTTGQGRSLSVVVVGLGLSLYKEVIREDVSGTFVAAMVDFGLAYRGLFGNIANAENDEARQAILGTKRKHFVGLEAGISLQVNAVKAGFSFYLFGGDVSNLSNGQVVAGFGLQGNFLSATVAVD